MREYSSAHACCDQLTDVTDSAGPRSHSFVTYSGGADGVGTTPRRNAREGRHNIFGRTAEGGRLRVGEGTGYSKECGQGSRGVPGAGL